MKISFRYPRQTQLILLEMESPPGSSDGVNCPPLTRCAESCGVGSHLEVFGD